MQIPGLYYRESPLGGRGVFTAEAIPAGGIIEICPVIFLDPRDTETIHDTHLHDYYFLWGKQGSAIALGYGSLYNHAAAPNADYGMDFDERTIAFHALWDIAAGEEITINYSQGETGERTELWFEVR